MIAILACLSAALATTLDGGQWFPECVGKSLPANCAAERIASLTPAQRRVLARLSDGLLNKQIAYELGMAEATVKVHMTALMRKLNVRNRTQVAIIASTLGWLPEPSGRPVARAAD